MRWDDGRVLTRRTLLGSAAAGVAAASIAAAPAEADVRVGTVLTRNLRVPWGLAFLPNGDALVGERPTGDVFRVRRRGGRRQVGTIRSAVDFGEGGLLGIAVAPTFAHDRWVYFY